MPQADRTVSLLSRLATDTTELQRLLSPGQVTMRLTPDVADLPQAQLIFSFATNLLSRLYPVVQDLRIIVPKRVASRVPVPRWRATAFVDHIRIYLEALNPPLRWEIEEQGEAFGGGIQVTTSDWTLSGQQVFYVGSDGWAAYLSLTAPAKIGHQINPVGAYTAACLGAAEVWKRHLYPHRDLLVGTPVVPLERDLCFSSFTYRTGPGQSSPPLPDSIDVGRLTFAGTGAGGGATAFTLATLTDIRGLINLIDPDVVIEPNLNRYVYADASDATATRYKVLVLKDMLERHAELTVRSFPEPHQQALDKLSIADLEYVVAAMHSREARRSIQYETPRVLWDAGAAESGEFFVWRLILGQTECMFCKHPPGVDDVEYKKAEQLVQLLGLDRVTWLNKLRDNEVFRQEEIDAIIHHTEGSKDAFALPAAGQRFGDWEAEQCGLLVLPELDDEIPVPFAPVMAGVLLAGEVIKERLFPGTVLDSYYWNTMVGQVMRRNQPRRRLARANCVFCHDAVYLDQYQRRWVGKEHKIGSQ